MSDSESVDHPILEPERINEGRQSKAIYTERRYQLLFKESLWKWGKTLS